MSRYWWLSEVKKLRGVTTEQMQDYIFSEALDIAIDGAVSKWEYEKSRKGRYYPDITPNELIVRYNRRTNTVHIRHWLNPFIRMTEKNFASVLEVINEEVEMFGKW